MAYSTQQKQKALELEKTAGLMAAAKQSGVSTTTLLNWKRAQKRAAKTMGAPLTTPNQPVNTAPQAQDTPLVSVGYLSAENTRLKVALANPYLKTLA
jgi:hypothetical protein